MPGNSSETQPTMTYPSNEQHARWKKQAAAMGMSLSEFIQAMTEAGLKKFTVDMNPDESVNDLRRQRNDLKRELDRSRDRVRKLEKQIQTSERTAIKEFVAENPGAELDEIIQHVVENASSRVPQQVDHMVTVSELQYEDGEYYE